MTKYYCPGNRHDSCDEEILDSERTLECDICSNFFHIKCQNVNAAACKAICTHSLFWTCDKCRIKCLKILTTSSDTVIKKISTMEEKINEIR